MSIKIYTYVKCSTCVKAQKFLKGRQRNFETVDITETPPLRAELEAMLLQYSGSIKKLFNTSGVRYRELGLSKKIDSMGEAELIDLLASDGKLVKRPFLVVEGQAKCVGFKESEWQQIFAQ